MICKYCGENISDQEVRSYIARLMGKVTGKSKARDSDKMKAAGREGARKRWKTNEKTIFPTPSISN